MEYRRLGRAGLKVSVLSYGTWVTFSEQADPGVARECLTVAREEGVNFFDTAEVYGRGRAELLLGAAIEDLRWERASFVLSTKLYWGVHDQVNLSNTLNRKYLLHAIDRCLERLRTPFVDLLFCHRPDPETTVEEVVWTMSDIVAAGKAHYWGTSEWSAEQIRSAYEVAERHGLRKPTMEQPEYSLVARERVEREYRPLCEGLGLGLTTWSPLASGLLTGKYAGGIPPGSRAALPGYEWLQASMTDAERSRRVAALGEVARELGCTTAQLAIAWCTRNPDVSTVILGASSAGQLRENLGALAVGPRLTPETAGRIGALFEH
ncbi:MAG: aldo/keto reductase [Actinomycetota bacterium]|nr:aldo/keto reductase [Actinomycetota bacterium]